MTDGGLKPRPIRRVAVIGGRLMGSGIVTALVSAGIPVLLKEVNQEYLQGGLDRIKGERRHASLESGGMRCVTGW